MLAKCTYSTLTGLNGDSHGPNNEKSKEKKTFNMNIFLLKYLDRLISYSSIHNTS